MIRRVINPNNYKLLVTSCLLRLWLGKLSWEWKAHVDGILGSVPIWPDVISSFQDKRTWAFLCKHFLALQAFGGEMVMDSLMGNSYKTQTMKGFLEPGAWGIWGQSCSLSWPHWPHGRRTACKNISGCRRCLIHLQVTQRIWISGFPLEFL